MTKEQFFDRTFSDVQRLQREAWRNKDFHMNIDCSNTTGVRAFIAYCHVFEGGKLTLTECFTFYPWDTEDEISHVFSRLTRFVRAYR